MTYVGPAGRSSFETMHEIRRIDNPDVLCAETGAKVIWVHFPTEKSMPLPEKIRRILPMV